MTRLNLSISIIFLFFIALSCTNEAKEEVDLDSIQLNLKAHRLDLDLYQASKALHEDSSLPDLQVYQQYLASSRELLVEWLFGGQDSIASPEILASLTVPFVRDSNGYQLLDTLQQVYPEGQWSLEQTFTKPMKRFRHYFPNKRVPGFFTYVDGYPRTAVGEIDQVYLSPKYIGVGLHYFLGSDFIYYPSDLPMYIRRRCNRDHIAPVVIRKMVFAMVPEPEITQNPVLIDYVVNSGIRMFVIDKLLGPYVEDTLKLLYTDTQMQWVQTYESRLYKEMLPDLYSVDPEIIRRYEYDIPFTSQLSRESAPRTGEFIGWQIIKAYMKKNPELSLEDLIQQRDYQRIFQEANYRPNRE